MAAKKAFAPQGGRVAVDGEFDGAVVGDVGAIVGGVEGGGEDAAVGGVGLGAVRHGGWCGGGWDELMGVEWN